MRITGQRAFLLMNNIHDWRLTNQDNYLKYPKLIKTKYTSNAEHDHCEFCWYKFKKDNDNGYCTVDRYHWICEKSYNDFKEMFKWGIVDV